MVLKDINHSFGYHTRKIVTMFFPLEKIRSDGNEQIEVITKQNNYELTVSARVFEKTACASYTARAGEDMARAMSLLLFRLLCDLTGFVPQWGILYGVRPARLMHAKTEELGEEGAKRFFLESLVTPEKTELAFDVMKSENKIIALSQRNSYSLYVSIPFCPSRCSYCSFVSHSIENASQLIQPYCDLLVKELKETAKAAASLGLRFETVYFGGGTPTTLSAFQLDSILSAVERYFDLSHLREFTVEAGRPDTVTEEKLSVLLKHNVSRISINPQTFSDEVLKLIGRRHTVEQTYKAYELAKKLGFNNINMDLIAGLSGDTLKSFENSVNCAASLGAKSITVHNLALKSGAFLVTENENYELSKRALAGNMIDYSYLKLKNEGYKPYYMYRQSKSLGNLENTGWCKEGFDCLYNVFMMDETHTVLSAGAGAVTKLKNPDTGHIERIYNYKYPYEYLNDFEGIIARKQGIYSFFTE